MSVTTERRPYDIHDVPERGDGLSRFMLPVSPTGMGTQPVANLANVYGKLMGERVEESPRLQPAPVTVKLFYARPGEVVPRGSWTAVPEFRSRRPSRIWRGMSGGELLDSFMLGREAFDQAPDIEVWTALADVLAQAGVRDDQSVRLTNDAVAMTLLARAGTHPPANRLELPRVGAPHKD